MFSRKETKIELNINQRTKEFVLSVNGSSLIEGEYNEFENNSKASVPFMLFDSQYVWLENVLVNWE